MTQTFDSLLPSQTNMFASLLQQLTNEQQLPKDIHTRKRKGMMKVNSSAHIDIELSASTPHPLSGDPLQIQRSFVNSDRDQLHITDAAR